MNGFQKYGEKNKQENYQRRVNSYFNAFCSCFSLKATLQCCFSQKYEMFKGGSHPKLTKEHFQSCFRAIRNPKTCQNDPA